MKATFRQLAILSAATALILPAAALAADPAANTATSKAATVPDGSILRNALPCGSYDQSGESFADFLRVCELTLDQQAKIKDIVAAREEAVKEKVKELRDADAAITKALQEKANLADAQKKKLGGIQAIGEEYKKAHVDVMAVLTKEQKARWQEYTTLKTIKSWYAGFKLTEKQWDKIIAAYEQLAKDRTLHPDDIFSQLRKKVDEMLTPQQKAQRFVAERWGAMAKACHLTDDQVLKLWQIHEAQLADLLEAHAKESAQLDAAWQQANQANDRDTANRLVKQQSALSFSIEWEAYKESGLKIQAALTAEQKAAWAKKNATLQVSGVSSPP